MDGAAQPHEFIFIDEAGFDLCKTRRRGRHVTGQRAIVHVPGQRGGNITLCAAISLRGLLHHHAKLGPYNSQHILTFLDALHDIVVQNRADQPRFVVIWDHVSFHRAALVQAWFSNHSQLEVVYLPPYSPFLNPIEDFFRLGDGVYMTANHMPACLFCRQWNRPAATVRWQQSMDGFDMQEDIFPGAQREKTLLAMSMRSCGQTPTDPWAHVCTIVMIFCVYSIVFFLLLYYVYFALSEFMVLQCTILSRPICFFGCLCLLKICRLNKQWQSKTAVFYMK